MIALLRCGSTMWRCDMTDRIVVLDAGRIIEQGPSHAASSRRQTTTVRRLAAATPTSTS